MIVTYSTGSIHFTGGDVWDDIEDHLLCTRCGEELDEMPGYHPSRQADDDDPPF
jgi:hypothetical protein